MMMEHSRSTIQTSESIGKKVYKFQSEKFNPFELENNPNQNIKHSTTPISLKVNNSFESSPDFGSDSQPDQSPKISLNMDSITRFLTPLSFSRGLLNEKELSEFHTEVLKRQTINRFFRTSLAVKNSFRRELIYFAYRLCQKLGFSSYTYYLSVAYLDVVLYNYSINDSQKQICVYMTVMVAAKFEEKIEIIPSFAYSVRFFENKFPESAFVHYEKVIVECLGWQLNVKTPFLILDFFLNKGVVTEMEGTQLFGTNRVEDSLSLFRKQASFILDLTSHHYCFNEFRSDVVAASAIICTRISFGLPIWSSALAAQLRLDWSQLEQCVLQLAEFLKNSDDNFHIRNKESFEKLICCFKNRTIEDMISKQLSNISCNCEPNKENLISQKVTDPKNTSTRQRISYGLQNIPQKRIGKTGKEAVQSSQFQGLFFENSFEENEKKKDVEKRISRRDAIALRKSFVPSTYE